MTQPRRILWLAIIAALVFLLPSRTLGQSAPATDDATIQLKYPTTNDGTSSNLGVVGPNLQEAFIRFDLSVLPSGLQASNINKATLRLFLANVSVGGTFDVRLVTGIWSETTLTYNNAPPAGLLIAGSIPVNTSEGRDFVLVDVTSAVQAWQSGTANNGIVLTASPGSSISVNFDSKENSSTSHDPQIEIEVVSVGPQGATGATGPPGTAATVQVGTTSTLGPTGNASVSNVGTPNAAILNFAIPQGPIGLTGPQGQQGQTGAQGIQGIPGIPGPIGQTGATGSQGPQGPVGINNLGPWSSTTAYNKNDAVFDSASYWLAKTANNGSKPSPTNTNWQLLAGGIVNQGVWSASGSYNVNDAVADQGSFWLALQAIPANGAEPSGKNTSWQLLAAKGDTGPQGANGAPGAAGQSVTSFAEPVGANCANGGAKFIAANGTTYACNGAAGPQGPAGPAGAAGGGGGGLNGIQEFTASGSWTAPVGVTHVLVEIWGGGGGGGSGLFSGTCAGGGGGGAGGYTRALITVMPIITYNIVVGSGGLGGVSTISAAGIARAGGLASQVTDPSSRVLVSASGGAGGTSSGGAGGSGGSGANTIGRNGGGGSPGTACDIAHSFSGNGGGGSAPSGSITTGGVGFGGAGGPGGLPSIGAPGNGGYVLLAW